MGRRNEYLMDKQGHHAPKTTKTGTTIVGICFKVGQSPSLGGCSFWTLLTPQTNTNHPFLC